MEAFYEKEVDCPCCGHKFHTLRVRSRFAAPYKIDSDFCPHFKDGTPNPHFYYVRVCPECGFAFTDEFSKSFPSGTKEIINAKISYEWKKQDFGQLRDAHKAIESLKLAIYSATLKKEKHAVLAGLCLRLAWIYRTEDKLEEESRFLKLALQEYEASYTYSDFNGTSMSELRVLFLIGELYRRLGQYTKAISYFSKIVEHPMRDEEPKILNMARTQWQITVEENRNSH
ncbi:hypothetical protein Desaci_3706 [Desulfosporosinus acidiphilus SJ4]|uniref:Uncharacterized protein n=1 Tax=Desulfosporosinus acidiphilus (strain DSM 22704 / JCM 16185 / SJ4) TaxID=646529 RepID=I4D9W3_DESAJ|nr:DUF2225 domain-containing protein [Desulfosporosinus acidiphilus]AFM42587.1 hypothetical protein Desaci_3706 [Desulfosporosinus acidiphilus SJ4]